MAFEQVYPLFAMGPRADLNFGYLNTVINGTTLTINASETSQGFNITRSTNGVYTVTFPKCRYVSILPKFLPTVAGNGLVPRLLAGIDPTAGTCTLELSATAAGAAADPAAANNELELVFLLGF